MPAIRPLHLAAEIGGPPRYEAPGYVELVRLAERGALDFVTLQVAREADGSLWAVFADTTSGTASYRFRFLRPPAPADDGTVSVDLNRTLLPPCAFADHFICPFPPPGNTLPVPVPAGERNLLPTA